MRLEQTTLKSFTLFFLLKLFRPAMKFALNIVALVLVYSVYVSAAMDDPKQDTKITPYHVKNRQELENTLKYKQILNAGEENVIFFLKESNSFLVKKMEGDKVRDIDDDDFEVQQLNGVRATSWWNPFQKTLGDNSNHADEYEWVEVQPSNVAAHSYPGFIPISGCQSHEFGDSGLILFSYLVGVTKKLTTKVAELLTFAMLWFGVQETLGNAYQWKESLSGSTTCNIPAGVTGQVIGKPAYVSVNSNRRLSWWSRKTQRFVRTDEFNQNDEKLLVLSTVEFYCITNDKAVLICDGRIGVPDWDSPVTEESVFRHRQDTWRANSTIAGNTLA